VFTLWNFYNIVLGTSPNMCVSVCVCVSLCVYGCGCTWACCLCEKILIPKFGESTLQSLLNRIRMWHFILISVICMMSLVPTIVHYRSWLPLIPFIVPPPKKKSLIDVLNTGRHFVSLLWVYYYYYYYYLFRPELYNRMNKY